jgi:hypothetical protein
MKKILLIIALGVCGCSDHTYFRIVGKHYDSQNPTLCKFYYDRNYTIDDDFTDTCSKYSVGDTIKH